VRRTRVKLLLALFIYYLFMNFIDEFTEFGQKGKKI